MTGIFKTNRLLLFVLGICLLGSCQTKQTNVYNILDYGATGDGTTDDAPALQRAIDACSEAGGGTVLVPAGHTFLCSPFRLASYVDLHLEPNSCLLANPDESAYTESAFGENRGEGDVEKLVIRDVTIRNSAYWTVHLIGCRDASIDGISILNNLKIRNGDGIDVDHSKDVRIANCFIESGDDCICLKNRREFEQYGPCEDVVVSNCTMTSRSCAIKIGSENMDSIRRVLFTNCIIKDSNRGIGIQNRDEGTVTDVTFSNMIVDCRFFSDVWWGKAEAIYVTSYPRAVGNHKDAGWRFPKGATKGACGEVYERKRGICRRRHTRKGKPHLLRPSVALAAKKDRLRGWYLRQASVRRRGLRAWQHVRLLHRHGFGHPAAVVQRSMGYSPP